MNNKPLLLGIGGGGTKVVSRIQDKQDKLFETAAVNTDRESLHRAKADIRLQIGLQTCNGLGARGEALIGRQAAQESLTQLRDLIEGRKVIAMVAGLGGGTGTGVTPVISTIASSLGVQAVASVSLPFGFEGRRRWDQAQARSRDLPRRKFGRIWRAVPSR